jgi:CheY-like chemotaxis protein/HPt (histidine-containing phosphotransfer) domain-containing protein
VLEAAGHEVDIVADGAKAVMAIQNKAYDLVLMDVQMPGMDGVTATQHIRALEGPVSQVPIVALTANVYAEQVASFRLAGMSDHLGKPFKRDELLAAVAKWVPSENPDLGEEERAEARPTALDAAVYKDLLEAVGSDTMSRMLDKLAAKLAGPAQSGCTTPGDKAQLAADAHALMSTAGMLGFSELSNVYRELETACLADADITDLLKQARSARERALAHILTLRAAA